MKPHGFALCEVAVAIMLMGLLDESTVDNVTVATVFADLVYKCVVPTEV